MLKMTGETKKRKRGNEGVDDSRLVHAKLKRPVYQSQTVCAPGKKKRKESARAKDPAQIYLYPKENSKCT